MRGESATKSLTGVGKAAVGAGIIGGAVAIGEMALALNDATENADDFATKLNLLRAATSKLDIAKAFNAQAQDVEGLGDKFMNVFNSAFAQGIDWGPFKGQIDNIREALDKLTDDDKVQALKTIKAMLSEAPAHPADAAEAALIKNLKERRKAIEESLSAEDKAKASAKEMTKAQEDNAKALKEWDDSVEGHQRVVGVVRHRCGPERGGVQGIQHRARDREHRRAGVERARPR